MDFTLIFKALYKPIIFVFKEIGHMFLNIEAWWIAKTLRTKDNLRWVAVVVSLVIIGVFREIEIKEQHAVDMSRVNNDNIFLKKKSDFSDYRFVSKLLEDIKELKGIKEIAVDNKKAIKTINKKNNVEEDQQGSETQKTVE